MRYFFNVITPHLSVTTQTMAEKEWERRCVTTQPRTKNKRRRLEEKKNTSLRAGSLFANIELFERRSALAGSRLRRSKSSIHTRLYTRIESLLAGKKNTKRVSEFNKVFNILKQRDFAVLQFCIN